MPVQFATPWDERSAEPPAYTPVPRDDFDHLLDFVFGTDPLPHAHTVDLALQLWSDFLHVPTDAGVDPTPLVEPLDAAPSAGVASNAHGQDFDTLRSNTGSQYPYTGLQACHGTELISATLSATSAVPGLLDHFFTPQGSVNTHASALYLHQQLAVESGLTSYGALPTHVSPADLILNESPSPIFDTPGASDSFPYVSPSSAHSYISGIPSFASEFSSNPVSPASGSGWATYSPSGSSPAAGASPQYATESSTSLSPVCSLTPFVGSAHSTERISTSARQRTARRSRPKSSASLSIQSSATFSSSPGKVRAAAPRNKQILYEPYEVPDGPLDRFVCPYCEPGRPFATPRRGRRKHDIERHLKTHFSKASRSEGSGPQVVCDRVVLVESLPGPGRPGKWWECEGRMVVGGCAKVFGREDSLLRHLKVGCSGPKDQWDCDTQ